MVLQSDNIKRLTLKIVILFCVFEILLKNYRDIQQGLSLVEVLTIQDGEVFFELIWITMKFLFISCPNLTRIRTGSLQCFDSIDLLTMICRFSQIGLSYLLRKSCPDIHCNKKCKIYVLCRWHFFLSRFLI